MTTRQIGGIKSSHDELQESVANLKNMQSSAGFMNQASYVSKDLKPENKNESKLSNIQENLMVDQKDFTDDIDQLNHKIKELEGKLELTYNAFNQNSNKSDFVGGDFGKKLSKLDKRVLHLENA